MNRTTQLLCDWYRDNRILYAWRKTADPYRVWLSEILLQQTRISVTIPFYEKIVKRFPTLRSLARTKPAEFLSLWSGIGYYRRAENMLRCAKEIESKHNGAFPSDLSSLLELPGIGHYTAGALRNLCFGSLTPAVDGNVARVLARVTACAEVVGTKPFHASMEKAFLHFGKGSSPPEYFQSLMELGERICLPKPLCFDCPVRERCGAFQAGLQAVLPRIPEKKPAVPHHWYFLVLEKKGKHFFIRSAARQFLKNAWLFPDVLSTKALQIQELQDQFREKWKIKVSSFKEAGTFRHAVTFRKIHGHVLKADSISVLPKAGKWLSQDELQEYPTSSVIRKALHHKGTKATKVS